MKFIRMKLAMFGRISTNTTRAVPRSSNRAASTNSRSFSENTWARTARVSTGQHSRDRRGDEADEDHRPAAADHLDQDVLALVVGAEQMPGRPGRQQDLLD